MGLVLCVTIKTKRFESVDGLRGCKRSPCDDRGEIRVFQLDHHPLSRAVALLDVIVNETKEQVYPWYEDSKREETRSGAREQENRYCGKRHGCAQRHLEDLEPKGEHDEAGHRGDG